MNFIKRNAEAYRDATETAAGIASWGVYAAEVIDQWSKLRCLGVDEPYSLLLVPGQPYATIAELRDDVLGGRLVKVWAGGRFSHNHPITRRTGHVHAYHLSRALHDVVSHVRRGFDFTSDHEMAAGLRTRGDFSTAAHAAQYTDDVAMGCYYKHFGYWPEIQRPVVVEPDWEGLRRYLGI